MAKKTAKKAAKKKTTKKSSGKKKEQPSIEGRTRSTGFSTPGFGTDHIAPSIPILTLKNRGNALIRLLEFEDEQGEKTYASSIRAHRVRVGKRWRWFTEPQDYDPLGDAGHNASYQWVALALLRGSDDDYHKNLIGRVCLIYFGRKAVDWIGEEVIPPLKKAKRNLNQVDLHWKRIGEGTNSVHTLRIKKPKPFTKDEKAALSEMPDVADLIKPLPRDRLEAIARRLSDGGGSDQPQGLATGEAETEDDTSFFED